jgi:hypothetical protein
MVEGVHRQYPPHLILLVALSLGCSSEPKEAARASAPQGPLAPLMTQHPSATCGKSDRLYDGVFWHPPYQTCLYTAGDTAESAEIDSDSVVVELTNTWTAAPANQAAMFAQAEGELTGRFGPPRRCSPSALEWRQGDTLHILLQIAPVSQVGTEFDEGLYRMTRVARLGPLDAAKWGC